MLFPLNIPVLTLYQFLFGSALKAVLECQKTLFDSLYFFQSSPFLLQRVCSIRQFSKSKKTFGGGNDYLKIELLTKQIATYLLGDL